MTTKVRSRRFDLPPFSEEWVTIVVELPAPCIQYLCVILEGYDNLALVRTPVAGEGLVYVYTCARNEELVRAVVRDLNGYFPVQVTKVNPGMRRLDELWED